MSGPQKAFFVNTVTGTGHNFYSTKAIPGMNRDVAPTDLNGTLLANGNVSPVYSDYVRVTKTGPAILVEQQFSQERINATLRLEGISPAFRTDFQRILVSISDTDRNGDGILFSEEIVRQVIKETNSNDADAVRLAVQTRTDEILSAGLVVSCANEDFQCVSSAPVIDIDAGVPPPAPQVTEIQLDAGLDAGKAMVGHEDRTTARDPNVLSYVLGGLLVVGITGALVGRGISRKRIEALEANAKRAAEAAKADALVAMLRKDLVELGNLIILDESVSDFVARSNRPNLEEQYATKATELNYAQGRIAEANEKLKGPDMYLPENAQAKLDLGRILVDQEKQKTKLEEEMKQIDKAILYLEKKNLLEGTRSASPNKTVGISVPGNTTPPKAPGPEVNTKPIRDEL